MHQFVLLCSTVFLSGIILIAAQSSQVTRCFQYTWLGPRYNNESVFLNATCQDATRLASGIPCQQPLVVSYDGSWPDVSYIWANHLQNASCILADNDICATYTYYFNGHVENYTAMCTRAVDTKGEALTRGCYEQRNGSFVTKVCLCRSVPGGVPCNNADSTSFIPFLTFILATVLLLNKDIMHLCYKI